MTKIKADPEDRPIDIAPPSTARMRVAVVGTTPLLCNAMSAKAKHDLLYPPGRKTAADKKVSLKHDPLQEYRDSVYRFPDEVQAVTVLGLRAVGLKRAIASAAMDVPQTKRSEVGRWVWVLGELLPLYGEPRLHMDIVKQAGISRAPDVRTRAIVPRWACMLDIDYDALRIGAGSVRNLLDRAGAAIGVGDGRAEKGVFRFGCFRAADVDDPELLEIVQQGAEVQRAALEEPEMYDVETESLYRWYEGERARRRG